MNPGLRGRENLYGFESGTPLPLLVASNRPELIQALRQRTSSIVVTDPNWSRVFALLLLLSSVWIIGDKLADVIKYAISMGYQVELKNDWDIGRRRISNEIILTPRRPVHSSGSSEE